MTCRFACLRSSAAHNSAARRIDRRGARLMLVMGIAVLTPVAASVAGRPAFSWDQSTRVEAAGDDAQANGSNPICAPVAANIARRIAAIRALRAAIGKAEAGPPASVKSALQGWFGKAEPTAKMVEQERRIGNERRSADELNAMLVSLNCVPVDVEAQLAQQGESASSGPVAPDAMPDDLVPVPHQH